MLKKEPDTQRQLHVIFPGDYGSSSRKPEREVPGDKEAMPMTKRGGRRETVFGDALPSVMSWRNRRREANKGLPVAVLQRKTQPDLRELEDEKGEEDVHAITC
ncbi:hypothetical protein WISP_62761 [Willisornis vidua]|uniref:Uncharacterized protein n=1 Tax=Willisornis vidua TaxID=1566151 RepID=A0ABQ9DG34_9PASS|nr:hypothetical protein WISP_62761 [Willisornis vidua]